LTKKYLVGSEIITALNRINLDVIKGEYLCILGTSGSGKTTLLHLTSGLERPTEGEVYIGNLALSRIKERQMAVFRRKYIGFIFQSFNLTTNLTALENVTMPLVFDGVPLKEREKRAKKVLMNLGLGARLNNKPTELSGGQQQRVCIARALINNPQILFADEPTGNLDTRTSAEILKLLMTATKEQQRTLIIVTHDRDVAAQADRVVEMSDGRIVKITVREEPA